MTGTDVRNARVMSGLRLGVFAQKIGVSLPTLGDMEANLIVITPAMVTTIEKVVDEELFKDADPSPGALDEAPAT